jgi:hypothetical protein
MSQTSFDLLGCGSSPHSTFTNFTLGDYALFQQVAPSPVVREELGCRRLDHVWTICGSFLHHGWAVFGPCLDHAWDTLGLYLGDLGAVFGPSSDHVWTMFRLCLGRICTMFRTYFWSSAGHFGPCLDHARMCGPCLGRSCFIFGPCSGHVSAMFGPCLDQGLSCMDW